MNKKAILKELIKDPQIKALYNEGFDRSIVNRLIVESLMEEEEEDTKFDDPYREKVFKLYTELTNILDALEPELLEKLPSLSNIKKEIDSTPYHTLSLTNQYEFLNSIFEGPREELIKNLNSNKAFKQTLKQIEEIDNILLSLFQSMANKKDELIKRSDISEQQISRLNKEQLKELKNDISELHLLYIEQEEQKLQQEANELIRTINKYLNSDPPEEANSDSEKGGEEGLAEFSPETIDAISKQDTPKEVKAVAQNLAQNIKKSKDINDEQKKEAVKNIYQLAQDKIAELTQGKTEDNLSLEDYKKIIESSELQQIKKVFEAIKQAFEENPKATDTRDLDLDEIKTTLGLNENEETTVNKVNWLKNLIKDVRKVFSGDSFIIKEIFLDMYELLFEFEEKVEDLLPVVVNDPNKESQALAIMNKKVNELEAISQKVLSAPKEDDKTGELATIGVQTPTDDTGEKPQTPEDEKKKVPEYIARESFLENWRPVGIAFDNYEDRFDQTPFLDEQAKVLFDLRNALKDFDSGLRKAAKPTGKREEAPEQVQEQAVEVIQVQPQEQKKIFKLHKELIRETNALVKIIKQLNDENIYTIGGGKIQKQARLKAKKLMNLMKLAFDELEAIKGEEKEKLTFKEQQEMDEETELLRKSHQQILSNMTKMDRIARARPGEGEDTRINTKYITPVVEKTIKIIEDIEHMFPVSSPFGKKGNLEEIKIQVKGISRDIIDIVAKLKDFAVTSKTKTQNVDKLKEYILNAMATISNSFDIDIEDEELKSLLPKKARPNSPSYNDGAADLKDKIDNFINKKGPVIAKQLKKKTLSSFMKVKEFITKNLKKEFGNKVPVIMVAKQLPEVEAEYIDEMEVITRFVDFMVRMLNENEKITFKESLRDFLKQFNFKDRSKLGKQLVKEFTREEIREIKDYLSKKNQLQDLVAVVKQQQSLSYEKKAPDVKDVEWEDDGPDEWRDRSQQRKPEIERLKVGKWKDYTDGNGLKATILNAFLEELKNTTFLKETDRDFIKNLKKSFRDKQQRLQVIKAVAKTKRKLNLSDAKYTWLKQTVASLIKNDRALFYALLTDDSEDEKNEQIERNIEKIIEHYLNTGKL